MEKYEMVGDLGSGSFAVTRLMRNPVTNELFAVKFLERGPKINENVAKEIINHRLLRHANIIRFIEAVLTPTHLAVKMEYAAGGNLLQRIQGNGRFSEDESRYFFQQLISGIGFFHAMQICHRDLKLENILLDGSQAPRLKICDFGFSSSSLLHSRTKDTVGTATYVAPEVYAQREYDGRMADVWSCGVILYAMLVGAYPFEDKQEPENFRETVNRILNAKYEIPDHVQISENCRDLLSRILVTKPFRRITIKEIKSHPWFLKNLPRELTEPAQAIYYRRENPTFFLQSVEEIMKIVEEAKVPPPVSRSIGGFAWGGEGYERRENFVMDKYEVVRDLGSGSFAVTRLMRNPVTNELFAVKFLERGSKINENVKREIINHQELRHPNIIRFIESVLTPTHLVVKMEYAAGGSLLQGIQENGRFSEDESRYFFQQLISGTSYFHAMQICHRDLKLENILLDGSPAKRLKICDFGFSSSGILHGSARATVGTSTYVAPEVYTRREYDGKLVDVWSCGVILYAMLVGAYPFEDKQEPEYFNRITKASYEIPDHVQISKNCRDLLSRILVTNPLKRINIEEIKSHPWFLENLPKELTESAQAKYYEREAHVPNNIILSLSKSKRSSIEELIKILRKASIVPSEEDEEEEADKKDF